MAFPRGARFPVPQLQGSTSKINKRGGLESRWQPLYPSSERAHLPCILSLVCACPLLLLHPGGARGWAAHS